MNDLTSICIPNEDIGNEIKPGLCNRITKISDSACVVGVCKKFELNPKVRR